MKIWGASLSIFILRIASSRLGVSELNSTMLLLVVVAVTCVPETNSTVPFLVVDLVINLVTLRI